LAATPLGEQLSSDCGSWSDVIRLCERFQPAAMRDDPRGCFGNALRCAVEFAILDAFGQAYGEPVSAVTAHYEPAAKVCGTRASVQYGAVIDSGNNHLGRSALARRLYGFGDCKVKVGHTGDDDAARLHTIRHWVGSRIDLRIDVNGAWRPGDVATRLAPLLPAGLSCVEQPVAHEDVGALAELRGRIGLPIMLDESLTGEVDARCAIDAGTCDLFNIRLSKCGGFLASLRLAAIANQSRLGYQLGCHPGESGILSAAGRHWATSVRHIRYVEGSYDRFLFRRLLTLEDPTFGYGGRAAAIHAPGLGVIVNTAVLADFTTAKREFSLA
jgi:muconate cycloisomerase